MIRLDDAAKEYRGAGGAFAQPVRALAGVSLEMASGSAIGVIGLNGAGKSTLLRMILGYVRPTGGSVSIEGLPPRRYVQQHGVAYVPEKVAIPGGWTVRGALEAYAALGGIGADTHERVDAALDRLGLAPIAARPVRALSKGNVQRLAIAQAILGNRKLMVLDEPTDGLDPLWIVALREIVGEWRAADPDRTLVLASHNLDEVERLVSRAFVLHNGELRAEIDVDAGRTGELERKFLRLVEGWEEGRAA